MTTEQARARRDEEQEKIKKNVLSRMKRIEGQVRGIQRMIEEGKECKDILVQVRAVRSALQSATGQILRRYVIKCHAEALQDGDENAQYEALEKAINVMTSFIDG
ncbi:metal-sensitive transcriptional regulator [Salidesulfovibrio brasiliensis]|uniref:metal-sensitive transcriptional regulator n=1 Tax=Salidesulfovibrio brasiliensis TaxID=221711 RepID=UPI0006D0DAA9|nr:metal-sensitive transcriptional regulator [Salidesulfovibrio brasiliensis]